MFARTTVRCIQHTIEATVCFHEATQTRLLCTLVSPPRVSACTSVRRKSMKARRVVCILAVVLHFSTAVVALPLYIYTNGTLAQGWTVSAYTAASGRVNVTQAAWTHLGSSAAVLAKLSPYGTAVIRAPSQDAVAPIAEVAFYVSFGPQPSSTATSSLGVSIATWLPGVKPSTSPVATLCSISPSVSAGVTVTPSLGAGTCTASFPDANGWVRVAMDVAAFNTSGWDTLEFSDTSGRGTTVYIDDLVLIAAADVAVSVVAGNSTLTEQCLSMMQSFLYECTVPPSDSCCATYDSFNSDKCACISDVRMAGGPDLALAPLLAGPAVCNIPLLVLQDSPLCFGATANTSSSSIVVNVLQAGSSPPARPQMSAAPTPAQAWPPPPSSSSNATAGPSRAGNAVALDGLKLVGPYIAIVASWGVATAVALRAMARRVDLMLRLGTADDGLAIDERLLKPLM